MTGDCNKYSFIHNNRFKKQTMNDSNRNPKENKSLHKKRRISLLSEFTSLSIYIRKRNGVDIKAIL